MRPPLVYIRLPGKVNSNSHGARHHLDDKVDLDQKVVNEELLSLSAPNIAWLRQDKAVHFEDADRENMAHVRQSRPWLSV